MTKDRRVGSNLPTSPPDLISRHMSSAPAGARSLSRHLPGWVMGAFLVAVVVGLLIEWLVPQASARAAARRRARASWCSC